MKKAALLIFLVLLIDQCVKIWIKTHMTYGQEYHVAGNWFIIHFTENEGMAFGLKFAGKYGKLILSVFRIIAIGAIGWYLYSLTKTKASKWLIISFALIMAGAIGNLIDSAFYGLIFNESSYFQSASFMPAEGGYAGFLYGKVVDMLYFPILHGHYPSWFPFWGGDEFLFFSPVFNIADSSITIGVTLMFIYQFWFRKD